MPAHSALRAGPARRSRSRSPRTLRLLVALLFLGAPPLAVAQLGVVAPDAEPFRGSDFEVEGRNDDLEREELTDDGLLLRHLFRLRPRLQQQWRADPNGFRGLAGSISNEAFYAFQDARIRYEIPEGPFVAHFRYRRDEDWDGSYDRVRFGVGMQLGRGWEISALTDAVAEKEQIDAEVETQWRSPDGHRFRASFTFVDAVFNTKDEVGGEYERQPYTYFAELRWILPGGILFEPWINLNSNLRRRYDVAAFDYTYRRFVAGTRVTIPIGESWQVETLVKGETGNADRRYDVVDADERRLDRSHFLFDVEARRQVDETFGFWFGARYLTLDERERRPFDLTEDNDTERREHMVKAGIEWQIHERILFWPGLYVNDIDNIAEFDYAPLETDDDDETQVALALPFEFDLGASARLTAQVNYLFHDTQFGGGSVHLYIPFGVDRD